MANPWAARLGLVSLSVLALAACNRGGPAQTASGSDVAVAAAGSDVAVASAGEAAQPLPPAQATAPVAPAPSAAAVAAAPEIAAAQSLDQTVQSGGADTAAYALETDGEQVRVWDDPGRGSRIVMPGGAISYYRPGADDPYLLRQGDIFYVLSGGRVARAYDSRGRAVVLQPAARTRVETVITRTRTVRRDAEQRRPTRVDDRRVTAAKDDARQAGRDALHAQSDADRARDQAQAAERAANKAERQADTPREDQQAKDARRAATRADRQADKAADQAQDAAKDARKARQQAAECNRQRARGEKVDKACAA